MQALLSAAEMREIEREANAAGLPYATMMQNAGEGAAIAILQRFAHAGSRVAVLCGPGNNGGDGLVCAAALARAGCKVTIWQPVQRSEPAPLVRNAIASGAEFAPQGIDALKTALEQADIAVDALLGIGTSRPLAGEMADALHALRDWRAAGPARRIVALDGPTGMNYDTGALDPAAAPADLTLTFHAPKRGHYCHPAAGALGELAVVSIGIAPGSIAAGRDAQVNLADAAYVRTHLPLRAPDANKGTHGRLLLVAGCDAYPGAPALAALGAYRAGAGLVTLAATREVHRAVVQHVPEATFALREDALQTLAQFRAGVIGPGLGRDADAQAALHAMLNASPDWHGTVIDADALTMLSGMPANDALRAKLGALRAVLTPHPGEMAHLLDMPIADVQADRIGAAQAAARQWNAVALLKGAHTVIAQPDGTCIVLPFANPALATAGTGDVLAGAIGALLAQGCAPFEAAVCGAWLHAAAGELWREANGDAGLLARDLTALLPRARKAISEL